MEWEFNIHKLSSLILKHPKQYEITFSSLYKRTQFKIEKSLSSVDNQMAYSIEYAYLVNPESFNIFFLFIMGEENFLKVLRKK